VLIGMGIGGIGIAASPGGAKAFDPASVANMAFWLKSEVGVLDAAGTPITSDSTAVATWQDQSGNGNHFTNVTAVQRPLWRNAANGVNGKPSVYFNNSLIASANVTFGSFNIFTVIKLSAGRTIYEQSPNNLSLGGFWLAGDQTATALASKNPGPVFNSKNHPTVAWGINNVTKVASHLYNGTNASHILNVNGINANMTVNAPYGLDPGTSNVTQNINLGARSGLTFPVTGFICEIIGYNASLSDANRTGVEGYLMSKWGI